MTQFYRVRINRKVDISRIIDVKNGKRIFERSTQLIEEVYGGLPHRAALSYQKKFPDAVISIEPEHSEGRYSRVSFKGERGRGRIETADATETTIRTRSKKGEPKRAETVLTGDYAEVINSMIEGAA